MGSHAGVIVFSLLIVRFVILSASLWEVKARKGLIVPAAGGGNRATNNTNIAKIYKKNIKS